MTCTWIGDFLKSNWETNLEKKIKITQIQPRFVLKFSIRFKFGMTLTWVWDFLYPSLETDLEENQNNLNTTQIDLKLGMMCTWIGIF